MQTAGACTDGSGSGSVDRMKKRRSAMNIEKQIIFIDEETLTPEELEEGELEEGNPHGTEDE